MQVRVLLLSLACLCFVQTARADDPVGSAYLRTFPVQAPPFGKVVQDVHPYEGVRMQRWKREQPEAEWLVVWIDLRTPGLGYRITPLYDRPGPDGGPWRGCRAQTTLDFLRGDPDVMLAVNTVAYYPFPADNGMEVWLSEPIWQEGDQPPASGGERRPIDDHTMLALFAGRALIDTPAAVKSARPMLAFGGFRDPVLVENEVAVRDGKPTSQRTRPHGRTVAGVSKDGRVLMLVIGDGYHPGVSVGLGEQDVGLIMQAAGAERALFLDGGGSTTLVGRDGDGTPTVLNWPAGQQNVPGTLRFVGPNLGFTGLRRLSEPLPAIPNWEAPGWVVLGNRILVWGRVHTAQCVAIGVVLLAGMFLIVRRVWRRWRGVKAAVPQ